MKNAVAPFIQRIRAEYLEMPGLSLKAEQVQHLCGVNSELCDRVLAVLVTSGFLATRSDRTYGRDRNLDISRVRGATPGLEPAIRAATTRCGRRAS